ncbi:MAG: hypothetical protein HQL51_13815 [Magnetococcales bacterium]|nr:hypothetical protein [Magnetococcales bacterium]
MTCRNNPIGHGQGLSAAREACEIKLPPHHPCLECQHRQAMPRECLPKGMGGPCDHSQGEVS